MCVYNFPSKKYELNLCFCIDSINATNLMCMFAKSKEKLQFKEQKHEQTIAFLAFAPHEILCF